MTNITVAVFEPRTGTATGDALIFGPVTPAWDQGAFFAPVIQALTGAGMRVKAVDTLGLPDAAIASMGALVEQWRTLLPDFGPVDLIGGNALGGAVAQGLLAHCPANTPALLVSGPARSDTVLDARLGEIADHAFQGQARQALALLAARVLPEGHPPADTDTDTDALKGEGEGDGEREVEREVEDSRVARRLQALRALRGLDISATVRAHAGPLLNIIGGRSQLVARRHTSAAPHHRVHVVPGAGMRPHFEQEEQVGRLVETFLHRSVIA
jgi:pimeloyl-ACP methyl ester carboxylesterase